MSAAAMSEPRVAVAGAAGRMGRTLVEAILASPDLRLAAAFECAGHPALGRDAGEPIGACAGIPVRADLEAGLPAADCLIDFTRPEGTLAHVEACRRARVAMVIGTTGFDAAGRRAIEDASRELAIVFAPNMSIGVNLMFRLAELAAGVLGDAYDIEIVEAHHRHKVDAPSGTALRIGEVVAGALGRDLASCAVYGREGTTGERDPKTIGFATVRGGDIVGEHTLMFAGTGERLEICHRAASRMTFALGALRAARYLCGRAPGLYDMRDVLGLR